MAPARPIQRGLILSSVIATLTSQFLPLESHSRVIYGKSHCSLSIGEAMEGSPFKAAMSDTRMTLAVKNKGPGMDSNSSNIRDPINLLNFLENKT